MQPVQFVQSRPIRFGILYPVGSAGTDQPLVPAQSRDVHIDSIGLAVVSDGVVLVQLNYEPSTGDEVTLGTVLLPANAGRDGTASVDLLAQVVGATNGIDLVAGDELVISCFQQTGSTFTVHAEAAGGTL